MKIKLIPAKWLTSWRVWSATAVVLLLIIFICLPHRTKVVESHATLQNGKTMDVKFTLKSAWGWSDPDRLEKMEVTLDGHSVPISPSAYSGSIPIKNSQPPIIVEKAGFPKVIAIGKAGNSIKETNWSFMNYGLSGRQVISTMGRSDSFYAPDPTQMPIGQMQVPQKIDLSGLATGGHMKKLGQ